jgi:hypothetical protein
MKPATGPELAREERREQSEVFSYLTSDEHRQLTDLIEKARTRKDAEMRPMGGEKPPEVQTPHAASNGQGHMRSPVSTTPADPSDILEFEPCPKCGRYATHYEEPIWVNRIPVWHKNCRGLPGATLRQP